MTITILNALIAVVGGVVGAVVLYWILNKLTELLPSKPQELIKPYVFILPAFAALGFYLVYPFFQTVIYSFANRNSTEWVGFDNYTALLGSPGFQTTLINTFLWILIVPTFAIIFGLIIATLADRLRPTGEKISKTLIFLPLAISAVGAVAIWRLVYNAVPANQSQTGVLNAVWTLFGGDPVNWWQISDGKLNSFLLMVILIWTQAGFAMVLLSAAIKGVPTDTLEAARIDGAGEGKIFFSIVIPQIRATMLTVFITVLIGVLKTFDVVYVATNGNFGTNIIALNFYQALFVSRNAGQAAAIVVILMLVIVPFLIYQIRQFRAEEAAR
ncbi:alpha-glucoside transport system permease protein [Quadrisphaera granulorum]|uniref:Alpha-glucoside transport system permease protein n=1 Tax=Quadrisphaera granulorum TaxID=317664 RepID=A0A316AWW2_9ACTN|nr:sugar ABC transporter permease [Quadrisphaera granulorum]PWJ54677.1 alpha-glucoside transport system permease protein [Quadrisphaera granulorum]SZE96039.1 alpha-glucoside transport system permease protein [Quadrisphaera granulorum]